MKEKMTEWVRLATLAPSGHNAQAWLFRAEGEAQLLLSPDFSRRLAVVDPADRELYISLGCALENLALAAGGDGYAAAVEYFPADAPDGIRVRFQAEAGVEADLAGAITARQSTRGEYDGRALPEADLTALQLLAPAAGVEPHFFVGGAALAPLADLTRRGDLAQYADPAFVDELVSWLRFTEAEALRARDGLFSRCSGNPAVPRWIGERFVRWSKPETMADQDAKKLLSSAGAVVFATASDDRMAWVETGRLYERFALTATRLGVRTALLNQPVEVAGLRAELSERVFGQTPQLLARFGYADEAPRSLRRPVEEVLH